MKRSGGKPRSLEGHQHGGEEDSGEGDDTKPHGERKKRRRRKRSESRSSLHGELLEFISQEWASLDMAEVSV